MIIATALEHLTVPHVRVSDSASLAETARAMNGAGVPVALVIDGDRCHGLVTATDLLRVMIMAPTIEEGWNSEVTMALGNDLPAASPEERLATVLERMGGTESDYLLLTGECGPTVLSFARMLQFDNTLLRRELDHLQTYIEALHDAPND